MNNPTAHFNVRIDPKSALPVHEQVAAEIKRVIMSGKLEKDQKVVSVKELAFMLQVNPNTIAKVYYRLEVEGFIYSLPGKGYFVKSGARKFKKIREEMFKTSTAHYITRARQLGYQNDEILTEVTTQLKGDQ